MKGKRGPRPQKKARKQATPKPNGHANGNGKEQLLQCDNCDFNSPDYAEIMEHLNGSGHVDYSAVDVKEPKKGELFTGPTKITRKLPVLYTPEEIAALNQSAATIAMALVEQRELAQLAKEKEKALQADQNAIVAKLRVSDKLANVECEWRIVMEENKKTLHRLDTDAIIETRALSAEDRAIEEKRVAEANEQQGKEAVA